MLWFRCVMSVRERVVRLYSKWTVSWFSDQCKKWWWIVERLLCFRAVENDKVLWSGTVSKLPTNNECEPVAWVMESLIISLLRSSYDGPGNIGSIVITDQQPGVEKQQSLNHQDLFPWTFLQFPDSLSSHPTHKQAVSSHLCYPYESAVSSHAN